MRSLWAALLLASVALAVPAVGAQPLPCDVQDCHVTVTVPPGVRCPEAGHYDSYTAGPVTVRVLHCDSGVPP